MGGCSSFVVGRTSLFSTCQPCGTCISGEILNVPGSFVSVIKYDDCHVAKGFDSYVISTLKGTAVSRALTQKIVVRRDLAQRLYYRYLQHLKQHDIICSKRILPLHQTPRNNAVGKNSCPVGCKDSLFLQALCEMM